MKAFKLGLPFLFVVFSLTVFAQENVQRNVGSFHEIRTGQAISVFIKAGEKESVRIEAKGIDPKEVLTEVSGGRLKIYLDNGRHSNHSVKVYVTYVSLDHLSASSASSIYSEGTIKGDQMDLNVSSAAEIDVDLDVNELKASVSSSGDLELKGTTKYLDITASSAGGVDAYELDAETVKVRASSAGGVKVHAIKEIDARASSGGSIRYRGNPEKSQTDSSSGGSVRKSS